MNRKDWGIFLGTVLLIGVFPWMVKPFKAVSHYIDVMVFAGIFSLISIGLSMLMGYGGQISLAQAAFFGIGAYSSGILTTHFGLNPWAVMPVGILLAADEETSSIYGLDYIMNHRREWFQKTDLIVVPDAGNEEGYPCPNTGLWLVSKPL